MGFSGTTGAELQRTIDYKIYLVLLDEATVPRLDTLTTKVGKPTLVQCQ